MRQLNSEFALFVVGALLGASLPWPAPVSAQVPAGADEAAQVFIERCGPCHTIGGGPLTGPDLEGTAELEPETLRAEVERMQDYAGPLSPEEMELLTGLLSDAEASARVELARSAAEADAEAAAEIEQQGAADIGKALFAGTRRLTHGGLPCAACHRAGGAHPAGGGTLSADLTRSVERLGPAGLIRAAEQASFPVMRAAYREHPVTHEEAVHLAAFLASLEPPQAADRPGTFPLVPWGTGVAAAGLALVAVVYRNRKQRGGGVRARLIRRVTRS